MNDDRAQILEDAADILLCRGWTQGTNGTIDQGELCLAGAVGAAADVPKQGNRFQADHLDRHPSVIALADYLGGFCRSAYNTVWRWNDNPHRTEDEVFDALKGAAKAIRNGQL